MKASELRIGNLVNGVLTQKPYIIDAWALREMESGNYQNSQDTETKVFKPIPLTEEWLLKFGFGMENKTYFSLPSRTRTNKSNKTFEYTKDLNGDWYIFLGLFFLDDSTRIYLEYVHQFQNLYFSLTGEEIVIKE